MKQTFHFLIILSFGVLLCSFRKGNNNSSNVHSFNKHVKVGKVSSSGSTYNVTSLADDGSVGTLRWAITNATSGSDIINLTVTGTIVLTSTLPSISNSVTINGLGATIDSISGNNAFSGLNIISPAVVAITGLSLVNCKANSNLNNGDGGAIYSTGTLTVTNCTFLNNGAASWGSGAAIYATGTLIVTNCTFLNNWADVYNSAGGAISAGSLIVTNCTFQGNGAGSGGAIDGGSGSIISSTFKGNVARAAGGAIYCSNMTIKNSTITGTETGLNASESIYCTNTTIINCTIVGNGNAGIGCNNCTIGSSIIAGNSGDYPDEDVGGAVSSLGYNLVGSGKGNTGFTAIGDQVGTSASPINPLVDTLANNGGPTRTMALLPGSPAIDAGGNSCPTSTDQRGIARPQGQACDIGAFESRGFTMTLSGGNNQSTFLNKAFASPLAVTVQSAYGEPVNGGQVTFTPPASGAGCTISGNPATITGVIATSGTVTSNAIIGTYSVYAGLILNGVSFPTIFNLANTSRASLLNGLISYWPLDENSGLAIDTAGGGNNGLPINTNQSAAGKINTAYSFNGTSSKVDMGNPSNLSLTTAGTVSCWVYMPSLPTHDGVIFEKADAVNGLNGYALFYQKQSNSFQFMIADSIHHTLYNAGSSLLAATWYHVVCTWSGTVSTYLNGSTVISSATQTYRCLSNVFDFALGSNLPTNSAYFAGIIDEVGVWNRYFNSWDVPGLYNSGAGTPYPSSGDNIPPVANAGPNQSLPVGTTSTTLNGSGTDADGTVAAYAWIQTSGKSATINSPSSASTTVTGLSPGTYSFQLTVTDNLGATNSDSMQVIVNPIPAANAGPNQTLPSGTTSATLSGSGTGTGLTYQWTQISGGSVTINSPTSATTQVSGLSVGTYTFLLTVTDNLNNAATSSVSVTVNSSLLSGLISYWKLDEQSFIYKVPAYDAGGGGNNGTNNHCWGATGKINSAYFFDGISSMVDMGNPPNLSLTSAGTVSCWVNFTQGLPSGDEVIFEKADAVHELDGYAMFYQKETNAFQFMIANGTSHTIYSAGSGLIPNTWYYVVCTWNGTTVITYLNGSLVSNTSQSYNCVSNVYDFALGANLPTNSAYFSGTIDEVGVWSRAVSATEAATLYNSGTGNQFPFPGKGGTAPIANAGPNQLLSAGTNSTTLAGSGQAIYPLTTTGYSWTQISGNSVTISSPSSAKTIVTGLTTGSYTFQLTVTDNLGATGSSTMNVFFNSGTSNIYNVTKTADDGSPGTLRWAITNATSGSDTVNFTIPGIITLTSALPDIANSVTINGLGANADTISGNNNFTAFNTNFVTKSSKGLAISGLTIANCFGTFTFGFGGGAITALVPLTLTNCAFSHNHGFNGPGAIDCGQLNATGCTFVNNSAGNGVENLETNGGAIYGGGGIISNSTFTGNSASGYAGAIEGGNLTISNCTIVYNLSAEGTGGVECYNCIISNSIIAEGYKPYRGDVWGSIISGGHNLIGNGDSYTNIFPATSSDQVGTTANPINPLVDTLANNGGPTETMALLPGSPAIDAGGNSCPISTDQRGIARPQGRACDIGAFESRGFTMTVSGGNNQSAPLSTAFANPLSVKVNSAYGEPVNGGLVTFSPPTSGASCAIKGTPDTIASGSATTGTVTANAIIGSYNVKASSNGVSPLVNFSLANTSSSSLQNGLISYWPLDESSGLSIDVAGGGNNGLPANIIQGWPGKINTAYLFNGYSSKVDMNNPANLSLTSAATVSCWVYMPALQSGDAVIFEKADASNELYGYAMFYQKQTNAFQFMIANGTNHAIYSAGSGLSAATWYHVVCSWNGSTVTTYLNGNVVSNTSQIYNCVSNVYDFALGGNLPTNTAYYSGTIDEVGVWNRALISSEVTTLYNSGAGNAYPFTTVTLPATGLNQNPALITNSSGASVRAYPNPYGTEINFNLKSSITGKGSLILYDVLGRKLATVFEGDFAAGSEITVSYKMGAAQRQPLIYVFTIGDDIIHGKLLPGGY